MKKKLLSIVLVISMFAVVIPLATNAVSSFTDTKGHWAKEHIEYAFDNLLMYGTSDTTFEPETKTTRAMIATTIHRIAGKPVATKVSTFKDLKEGDYYVDAVNWAAENEIIFGRSDTVFSPNDIITRQDVASMLYRYAKFKGYDLTSTADLTEFPDHGETSDYAQTAMKWVVGKEFIVGTDTGILMPKGSAVRGQLATILSRFDKIIVPIPTPSPESSASSDVSSESEPTESSDMSSEPTPSPKLSK